MDHCPSCQSRAVTVERHAEGVRVYSCFNCNHTWETVEVPSTTLRSMIARSLKLGELEKQHA